MVAFEVFLSIVTCLLSLLPPFTEGGLSSIVPSERRLFCLLINQNSNHYEKKAFFYLLESTVERRSRRNRDIKALFQHLVVEEGFSFMDAYEAVGYHFYESADHIRKILRIMNKSGQNAHNTLP